ncbi:hypothetical protein [Clostridium botulinum]|nr:hypothetical protein [Clostridium botulinum]MBY6773708.1 hypothetical protein [Clostridium botulinum]MBY6864250.1 hypothetical protein [Clostridium botulinum]MBY6984806.1 hypothetical protein [Clostridium botulinum]
MDLFSLDKLVLNSIKNITSYHLFLISVAAYIFVFLVSGYKKRMKNK